MARKIDEDVLDKVLAIWMLACNDRDPIITYRGIADRVLGFEKTKTAGGGSEERSLVAWKPLEKEARELPAGDVRRLELEEEARKRKEEEANRKLKAWKPLEEEAMKLVKDWPELFSPVVATRWFEAWQRWVIRRGHYPRWVIDLWPGPKTAAITKKRREEIENLERGDVFRSQFRAQDRQGPCTTEQVRLGIEHLDGLRKAWMEAREEKWTRYTFGLPAVGAVLAWMWTTLGAPYIKPQPSEISYQIVRLIAEPAYASALGAMRLAFDAAANGEGAEMQKQLTRIRANLLRLEPLTEKPTFPELLWDDYNKFGALCLDRLRAHEQGSVPASGKAKKDFDDQYKGKFDSTYESLHNRLYGLMVDKGPE